MNYYPLLLRNYSKSVNYNVIFLDWIRNARTYVLKAGLQTHLGTDSRIY